jgi:hypothetical protein
MKSGIDTEKEVSLTKLWICYRCNLTFENQSVASLHTILSGHRTCKCNHH